MCFSIIWVWYQLPNCNITCCYLKTCWTKSSNKKIDCNKVDQSIIIWIITCLVGSFGYATPKLIVVSFCGMKMYLYTQSFNNEDLFSLFQAPVLKRADQTQEPLVTAAILECFQTMRSSVEFISDFSYTGHLIDTIQRSDYTVLLSCGNEALNIV